MTVDEGVLDPWVAAWFEANPMRQAFEYLSAENLALTRGPVGFPITRELAHITDEVVDGVPVRVYQGDRPAMGLVVYLHGGGFCIGSIGLMDNVARELAHCARAAVISVEYRLAPEYPYPAGLDDCERVTRWAMDNTARFGIAPGQVAVAGESAGGNLAAAVSLRLRGSVEPGLAAQVLVYPVLDADAATYPSRTEFDGIVLTRAAREAYWAAYSAGRDLDHDQFAAPLQADSRAGLPPALIVLGGCDLLRDEGRRYAERLRDDGVAADDVCHPGQPHGFVNFMFPAAQDAFDRIGTCRYGAAVPNKVKVGFFSFTEVLDGRHREYNDWHLLDHMPENFKLDGLQWGQRWVATPELIERRLADGGIAASQYVTLYLITDPVRQALYEFRALGRTLDSLGRFFKARRAHLSGPFRFVKAYAAPRVRVDAEVIPYRPNRGVFVTVQDRADGATEAALDEARQWYDEVHIPDLLGVRGVAGCWWFEAMTDGPGVDANSRGRTIRAYWLDDDPIAVLDDLQAKTPSFSMMDLSKAYRTVLVGAYRSIPWESNFDWFD